ncbi:MAG: Nif11-like leader peptide family natural product precursor [Microcystis aeruginosa SX13-01]|nr:Nif11-like leader peptide family natural product precursor [Microcystis aeruginosa SX13-01]
MALEQVHAFYQKVASDESFRSRIQSVNSKEECSEIVKAAGFDFTPQEFEEYTDLSAVFDFVRCTVCHPNPSLNGLF